jgi:hypothetical protein
LQPLSDAFDYRDYSRSTASIFLLLADRTFCGLAIFVLGGRPFLEEEKRRSGRYCCGRRFGLSKTASASGGGLSIGCCLLGVVGVVYFLQSLHRLSRRSCWQKLCGLQSLHWAFWRMCWQKPVPQSLHWAFWRP